MNRCPASKHEMKLMNLHSQSTSEKNATCRLLQFLTFSNSTSKTSHCFALKKVEGPTGGPSSGGTTTLLRPPTLIVLMPSSNPATYSLAKFAVAHNSRQIFKFCKFSFTKHFPVTTVSSGRWVSHPGLDSTFWNIAAARKASNPPLKKIQQKFVELLWSSCLVSPKTKGFPLDCAQYG